MFLGEADPCKHSAEDHLREIFFNNICIGSICRNPPTEKWEMTEHEKQVTTATCHHRRTGARF